MLAATPLSYFHAVVAIDHHPRADIADPQAVLIRIHDNILNDAARNGRIYPELESAVGDSTVILRGNGRLGKAKSGTIENLLFRWVVELDAE